MVIALSVLCIEQAHATRLKNLTEFWVAVRVYHLHCTANSDGTQKSAAQEQKWLNKFLGPRWSNQQNTRLRPKHTDIQNLLTCHPPPTPCAVHGDGGSEVPWPLGPNLQFLVLACFSLLEFLAQFCVEPSRFWAKLRFQKSFHSHQQVRCRYTFTGRHWVFPGDTICNEDKAPPPPNHHKVWDWNSSFWRESRHRFRSLAVTKKSVTKRHPVLFCVVQLFHAGVVFHFVRVWSSLKFCWWIGRHGGRIFGSLAFYFFVSFGKTNQNQTKKNSCIAGFSHRTLRG